MNSSANAFVSIMLFCLERSRFSELATGWTTEEIDKFSARARNYSFVQSKQSGSRVHATSYSVGTEVFTAGLKWPESESNRWASPITKTKNTWSRTSISLYLISWRVT